MADETKNPAPAQTAITPAPDQGQGIAKTLRPSLPIGLVPHSMDEAWRLAQYISKSELAPKDYRMKPENTLVAIMYGAELGFKPMQSLSNISVINGRASLWGDLALALIMSHPEYEDHKEWEEGKQGSDDWTFCCTIKRKGKEPCTKKFSVGDAKTAKLWQKRGKEGQDTPWITYPQRMLAMRARSWAIRDRFADAMKGLHIAEEAMDLPPVEPEKPEILMPRREAVPEVIPATVTQEAKEPLQPRSYTEPESKTRTEPAVDAREAGKNATIEQAATGKILEGKPKPPADICGKCGKQLDPNFDHFCSGGVLPVIESTAGSEVRQIAEAESRAAMFPPSQPKLDNTQNRPEPKRRVGNLTEDKWITNTQRKKLFAVLRAGGKTEQQLYDHVWMEIGQEHLHMIPKTEFDAILKWAGGEALKIK